jgi:TetR/AcrR family transcriptional regulator
MIRTMVRKSNGGSDDGLPARVRRRAEQRRMEILRAAARVFRKRGFAATGMREIAAEADLSPANLYHYFQGKNELLYFCQDRALDQMLDALGPERLSAAAAGERLHAVIRAHVRCLLDEVEGSTAHLEIEALPDKLRRRIVAKRDRYERGIRRLVAAGVKGGAFAPCEPELVTKAMLGAINWTARWFRAEGPRSSAAVADSIADFLVRGLAAGRRAGAARSAAAAGGRR